MGHYLYDCRFDFFRHPRDLLSGISILDILYEDWIPAQKHYRDDSGGKRYRDDGRWMHYWCGARWKHYRDDGEWTHYLYDCRFDVFLRHPRDLLSGISILDILYEDWIPAQKHYRDDAEWTHYLYDCRFDFFSSSPRSVIGDLDFGSWQVLYVQYLI